MIQSDGKRKFLVVCKGKEFQDQIKILIEEYVSQAFILFANNGLDAISKIQNDPPDIVIAEPDLPKSDGYKLTHQILNSKHAANMAIILLTPVPNNETFVDQVVSSQVQFCDPISYVNDLPKSITKALNFLSHKTDKEFFMKFLNPGDVLLKEGDKADNVYLVKKGELIATTNIDGNSKILGTIVAGEFVGEMAYINGEPRSATVTAESECELISIPIQILDSVLFTKPSWSKALMKTLSKRVKKANQKTIYTKSAS